MVLDNVKNICARQNIDLTILAKRLEIQRNALYITLRNKGIRLDTLKRIAVALHVTVSDLVKEDENENDNNSSTHHEQPATQNNSFVCPYCGKWLHVTPEEKTSK